MSEHDKQIEPRVKRITTLTLQLAADGIPFLTAVVMAADMVSAEEATERVKTGNRPLDELHRVGSYAKLAWAEKHLQKRSLLARLPELWVGSDPDDTNPGFLKLWKEAYRRNGNKTILDSKQTLPAGKLTVYRGQIGTALGISWTTDLKVAKRFARSGGTRNEVKGGKVLTRVIDSKDALAYLTGRGESEVIIDHCSNDDD